jgi:hypothetical protein
MIPQTVKTGDYLGDLTDGLEKFGSGSYIEEFISCGPKTTRFLYFAPSRGKRTTKCKVKCINLIYEYSNVINLTALRNMILKTTHVHNPKKMKCKHSGLVISEPRKKKYKVIFKKHQLTKSFDSFLTGTNNLAIN